MLPVKAFATCLAAGLPEANTAKSCKFVHHKFGGYAGTPTSSFVLAVEYYYRLTCALSATSLSVLRIFRTAWPALCPVAL